MRYLELTLGLIKLSDIHIRQAIWFSDGLANLNLQGGLKIGLLVGYGCLTI